MLKDMMGRMVYLWIFFIQTVSLGLTSARDGDNLGFKRRLMRSPEEPNYRFLMPSRYQLIATQNIFYWELFRTQASLNGNDFLSLFLPDEYKRSDFRFGVDMVVSPYNTNLQLQLSSKLRAVAMVACILYLDKFLLFRKPRSSTFKVRLF